ncbi:glucose-6-phosphate dehydrogenase [Spirochaeta africana]|uniref:Glucose-6-phosphate 1-dehydrogenase n=1 Tax=Spirochaeta africana (strain ATCC 700263 / DSM 8902 / Z-7692) TaxID=889378 RepID=H9UFL4_SPIAZ|nr:glucose-6-phosphate dehydrogenase [Spirochaeta africana]AFG36307.1 glucose-6-phosphate 1-dehydrogenase [Spirochaeta africana DSM 8902]
MKLNPLMQGIETHHDTKPFVLFIFGVTGDLTRRKLMPAMYNLYRKGFLTRFRIVGFARRPWSTEYFREQGMQMLEGQPGSADLKQQFIASLEYLQSTFEDPAGYERIESFCDGFRHRLFYLSTPPASYQEIITQLGKHGYGDNPRGFSRIIIEKPFGRDLASARELNQLLSRYFSEPQIFRIDHYLGKETVQNIMMLRFGNAIFEPLWNRHHIDHVQITVGESLGVGTRANYYDKSGALRDMVQNHLFQLLSLTAMEPPSSLTAEGVRGEKVKVLQALRPITYKDVNQYTVRARYTAGFSEGEAAPGYLDEDGVPPDSTTETYTALELYLDTWRWSGVPFFLRTGKRLARKVTEIAVHFKTPPLSLFTPDLPEQAQNVLVIRIQPGEGITLHMNAKIPGHENAMRPVNMDFSYGSSFGIPAPEAYERLILDAILGEATLYTRRDEIEAGWKFVTRILSGWEKMETPVVGYPAGSTGPELAKLMIGRHNRRWRKL